MSSKVDRELAEIEERRAEAAEQAGAPAPKGKVRKAVKRVARDMALRRVSTKQ